MKKQKRITRNIKKRNFGLVHIPAHHEHPFRTNVNTRSGLT